MYKEEDLMKAFEKARKGSKDYYEDFCTMLFDEVRRLVSLVYEKESNINKLVNHIFNKLRPRLNEFDPGKEDIHRWISVFSSGMIYSVYNMSNSDVFTYREENSDYEIGYIEEDDEFAECAIYFNRQLSSKKFSKSDSAFSLLTKGQIILYELFCYAGCTVEEIEELLEVDGVYICSELCDIKKVLLKEYKEATWVAGAPEKKTSNIQKEEYAGDAVSDNLNSVSDEADYDDTDYDDMDDSSDDTSDDLQDESGNAYAAYLNGSDEAESETKFEHKRKSGKKKSGGLLGMFEQVPDKMMKLIAMILVTLILLVGIVIAIFFDNGGKKNNNYNNSNSNNVVNEQQSSTKAVENESETTSQSGGKETEGQSQTVGNTETNNGTDSSSSSTETATKATQATKPQNTGAAQETQGNKETEGSSSRQDGTEGTKESETETVKETVKETESESKTTGEETTVEPSTDAPTEAPKESTQEATSKEAPTKDGAESSDASSEGASEA